MQQKGQLPLEALSPLMTIVNRFERVGRSGQEHLPGSRSTCARASTPSTAAATCSGCCSSTSTTPAAARWPRPSASRSASPSSCSPAPAWIRRPSIPRRVSFLRDKGLDISRHTLEGRRPGARTSTTTRSSWPWPRRRGGCFRRRPPRRCASTGACRIPRRSRARPRRVRAAYEATYEFLHAAHPGPGRGGARRHRRLIVHDNADQQ